MSQHNNLLAILDALDAASIDAEFGDETNEWIELALSDDASASLIIGYPMYNAPLAYNVRHTDGGPDECGDVNVGDDPEAVANWALGFMLTDRRGLIDELPKL